MSDENNFFDLKKVQEDLLKDEVMEEMNALNEAVKTITKERGQIHLSQMTDDEAEVYFNKSKQDVSYYAFFRYSLIDSKKKLHWYRNRFACLTYSETFPVWIIDLKEENQEIKRFTERGSFHEFVKTMVNKESFIRSLKRAMNGIVNIEDNT